MRQIASVSGLLCASMIAGAASAAGGDTLSASAAFTAADGVRSYMDVGGVWDGSDEVTLTEGDTFTVTLTNNDNDDIEDIAFDLNGSVTLPPNFNYVAGTISGFPGLTANQVGQTLTFGFPADTDLGDGESIQFSFGLTTTTDVSAGTSQLNYDFGFGTVDEGSDGNEPVAQNIVVRAGASIMEVTPTAQTAAVTDSINWSIKVTNTGLGGLFDVLIDERALDPNPGNSLQITSMSQVDTEASTPDAVENPAWVLTIPYLPPGNTYIVSVDGTVTGCDSIDNLVLSNDRTGETETDVTASVTLDLEQPLVTVNPASVQLQYSTPVTVSVAIDSVAKGDARNFRLESTLPSRPVTVSNVHPDWSYAAGTGIFTYIANGGSIDSGEMPTLTYDVVPTNICTSGGGGTIVWTARYTSDCGDAFATPTELSGMTSPTDAPSISVGVSTADNRIEVGTAGQYTVTLSASNRTLIGADPVVVTSTLPAGVTAVSFIASNGAGSVSCAGGCEGGDSFTWSVDLDDLAVDQTLTIDFTAPTDPCTGGDFLGLSASVDADSTAGCSIDASGGANILLGNNPDAGAVQNFNIDAPGDGIAFETGLADDGDGVREDNEGEFIPAEAVFSFGAGYPGSWMGSTFTDDYASIAGQTLVPGSIRIDFDGGGPMVIPPASFAGAVTQTVGALVIDLGFLEDDFAGGDPNVAGHTLIITYETTIPNDPVLADPQSSLTRRVRLDLAGGAGGGACTVGGTSFTQGDFMSIARGAARVSVNLPSQVTQCATYDIPIVVSSVTSHDPSDVLVTFDPGDDYEYLGLATTPYAGLFNAGNIVVGSSGGDPTFRFTGGELTSSGTINVQVQRRADGSDSTTGISARVDYNDHQNEDGGATPVRNFNDVGSDSPFLLRQASLAMTTTPQSITVTGNEISWTVYVTNTGNGVAYGATLSDLLPDGLSPNVASSDAANPGYPAMATGQLMEWDLGDLSQGETRAIAVVANVDGDECAIANDSNLIEANWGCSGVESKVVSLASNDPDLLFLAGQMQVLHDTSATSITLCDDSTAQIIVRNTGTTHIYDVSVSEALNPATTGLSYVGGSTEFSIDGTNWFAGLDPTGAGTTADPYVWTSTEVCPLGDLAPNSENGDANPGGPCGLNHRSTVYVRFGVASTDQSNGVSLTMRASATAATACGDAVSSPGANFTPPLLRPEITVTTTGRNLTNGQVGQTNTVIADAGDTVEWTIEIENDGDWVAQNVELTETFVNTSGTNQGNIVGSGGVNTTIDSGVALSLPDVPANTTHTYTITETLGGNCVDGTHLSEVTWGCASSNLEAPDDNDDTALLVMNPDFSDDGLTQAFTPLGGGGARVTITLDNAGNTASSVTLTNDLPANVVFDTTVTPTLDNNTSDFTVVSVNATDLNEPVFTFTGSIANGDSVDLVFEVIPDPANAALFDSTSDPFVNPETTGNGLDPTAVASGASVVTLDFTSSCSEPKDETDSATLDLRQPDLDIEVDITSLIVKSDASYTFDYTVTNNGESTSIADEVLFSSDFGTGWDSVVTTVITPGSGGTGGVCASGDCTSAQLGTLAQGESAFIRVSATARNNGNPLTVNANVTGVFENGDGSATGRNYSFDEAGSYVAGYEIAQSLVATSESASADDDVLIGEDATWRVSASWFGGGTVDDATVRITLPAGLGYISSAAGPGNDLAPVVTSPGAASPGIVDLDIATLNAGDELVWDVIARTLNVVDNEATDTLEAAFDSTFVALGQTFGSDEFGGTETDLALTDEVTIHEPDIEIVSTMRNVTRGDLVFTDDAGAVASDVIEYRLVVTNNGDGPAFDLAVTDTLDAKMNLQTAGSDGIDNDGDGVIDDASEGVFTAGLGGTVSFTHADTLLAAGSPSVTLAQLDPGESVTLLYRATVDGSANPSDVYPTDASVDISSLPGTNGGQNAPAGDPDDADGERTYTDDDSATLTIQELLFGKSILATSDGTDDGILLIGEQVRFELRFVAPAGTIPNLVVTDFIPSNLSLVETPAVSIGSAISGGQPAIVPAVLPANGSPLEVTWDFGTRTVAVDAVVANRTIVVTYLTQVRNVAANAQGTMFSNDAMYEFDDAPVNMGSVDLSVIEPALSATLTSSVTGVPDAGDTITYTVTIPANASPATAWDANIQVTLPDGLTYTAASTDGTSGPAIGEPDVNGQVIDWGRLQAAPQNFDLAVGTDLSFDFEVTLDDSVEPDTTFDTDLTVTWTSLDGDPGVNLGVALTAAGTTLGERIGTGGVNDFAATDDDEVTSSSVNTLTQSASGETVDGDGFRIGDIVTYTIEVDLLEGTTDDVIIRATLPDGMEFVDFDAITPDTGNGGFTFTPPTGADAPSAEDTGAIQWTLGTVVNEGDNDVDNDTLTLVYRARILDDTDDIPVTPLEQDLDNPARLTWSDADGNGETTANSTATITVDQPQVRVALDGPAMLDLGIAGDFTLRAINAGDAPAEQPILTVRVPEEVRDTDPTTLAFEVSVAGDRSITFTEDTDYTIAWDDTDGDLLVTFISSEGYIGADETISVDFQTTLNNDAENMINLAYTATALGYFGQDVTGVAVPETRAYSNGFGVGTTGTANGAAPDDATDDHVLIGEAPTLSIIESVSLTDASPGDTLTYQIVITNNGDAEATGIILTDALSTFFEPGTMRNPTVDRAATIVLDDEGGADGTGLLVVSDIDLPVSESVTITFMVDLIDSIVSGTVVTDQAQLTLDNFGGFFVSDSNLVADNDPAEQGNDAGDANDDDPVQTLITSAPELVVTKSDLDVNENVLESGDVIRYTITVLNMSGEPTTDAMVQDAIPANTTYVAGTTRVNGSLVADVGGDSALVTGVAVQSPGEAAGVLTVGNAAVVRFDVQVNADVGAGSAIINQAVVSAEGEGSGPIADVPSDDPNTPESDDPTRSVVGAVPVIDATKTVTDDNGGTLGGGESLTYTITIGNSGVTDAANVVFTDAIPADTTYVNGSLRLDPDGDGAMAPIVLTDAADGDAGDFNVTTAGSVTVAIGDLAVDDTATVTFGVMVAGVADGTAITNQGVVSVDGLPDEPTDVDGIDADGDEPTVIVVGAEPLLRAYKQIIDLDGGVVDPGDTLEYVITMSNDGPVDATNVVVTDPVIPAFTTYVAGSTRLDGAMIADAAGPTAPLLDGETIGSVAASGTRTLRFRVIVDPSAGQGDTIENQASFTADGGLAGISDSILDDGIETGNDAGDPNDDEPTRVQIGASPNLANVAGTVWQDTDHDRIQDDSEPPLAGWKVEVVLDGIVLDTAFTDENGNYALFGLPPGSGYELRFRHPETNVTYGGPVSSEPGVVTGNGTISNLTLSPGTTVIEQSLPLDPSGVLYDVITRLPIQGARVTFEGPPGYDPDIHLLPGQPVQFTGSDGYYRFDLVPGSPVGLYRLVIVPPDGYLPGVPSSVIAPEPGPLDPTGIPDPLLVQPQSGPPQGNASTTYYLEFDLAIGDPNVINNHIPLDPILEGAIALRKTTQKTDVVRGDLIPYTIEATNTTPANLTSLAIEDTLPPGFKYVEGSARVDGMPVVPDTNGRLLSWSDLTFAPGEVRTVTLIAVVGSGVGEGEYINRAVVVNTDADEPVSNTATASVRVIPDPTFDVSDLIGTVFLDRNQNGYQDEGEPGIPGARVATATGLLITTDEFGRYHVAKAAVPNASRGSNFIVKLDPRSLPTGHRITTENPRVVRLTRGKITKANFGVSLTRVVRLEVTEALFTDEVLVQGDGTPGSIAGVALNEDGERVVAGVIETLDVSPSVLRLVYVMPDGADTGRGSKHLQAMKKAVRDAWAADAVEVIDSNDIDADPVKRVDRSDRYPLIIEAGFVNAAAATPGGDAQAGAPASLRRDSDVVFDREDAGAQADQGDVRPRTIPANTERQRPDVAPLTDAATSIPYRITVDGEVTGTRASAADGQRRDDIALHANDIQVRYDPKDQTRTLNVVAVPNAAVAGQPVEFRTFMNYRLWVNRGEIRIFAAGDSPRGAPAFVLPLDAAGNATWNVPPDAAPQYRYVVRVYDREDRFDETAPKELFVADIAHDRQSSDDPARDALAGYGENHLEIANIPVNGGAVVVNATNVDVNSELRIFGESVPVDPSGTAAAAQILPAGSHTVTIDLVDSAGEAIAFERDIYIPDEEWFYVAIADLTVSGNDTSGPASLVTGDDTLDDDVSVEGRLAFYVKGKLKGDWFLTASGDTREGEFEDMFSNFNDKDPRSLLRRLDADRLYPVYGDDSTLIEDAPTNGKLYVRVERGDTRFLWGNFYTKILDTDLAQIDRALYGAQARIVSDAVTSFGERRSQIEVFAAEPETLPAREEFRGTGGSVYFLQHQDLLSGSERVRIEVRDRTSGLVVETRALRAFDDYDIDPIQGRIILTQPLLSVADDGQLIVNGTNSGDPQYLVVRYEYNPAFSDLDDVAVGGRASTWINDVVRVGVTADHQERTGGDQDLLAGDVTIRFSDRSSFSAEMARTKGPGNDAFSSLNGGFEFDPLNQTADPDAKADAFRLEATVDFIDLIGEDARGRLSAYYEDRERGFSAPGQLTPRDLSIWGIEVESHLRDDTRLRFNYDERDERRGRSVAALDLDILHDFNDHWYGAVGLRWDDLDDEIAGAGGLGFSNRMGERLDAQVRAGYRSGEDWDIYAFLQQTLNRSGDRARNDRVGAGGTYRLTDKLTIGGEVSGGTGGLGGLISADYAITDRTSLYGNVETDADRSDTGYRGRTTSVTTGARTRFSDELSVFVEGRRVDAESAPSGLSQVFGLDLGAADDWTIGFTFEHGELDSEVTGEIERISATVSAGFADDDTSFASAIEFRDDRADSGDRSTWFFRNSITRQANDSWRLHAKLNVALSDTENGDFFNGDFIEGVLGAAYRPTHNDRWNMLFKYTYFEDLPSPGQISRSNQRFLFEQRSHVLSVDATYDVNERLSIGGKYGFRFGELRAGRVDEEWFSSTAHLAILRADWHVVHEWDALIEGRALWAEEAEDMRSGVLLGVFRHVNENLRFGVGYNFTDFSDDLTDLDYDHAGWFINLTASF